MKESRQRGGRSVPTTGAAASEANTNAGSKHVFVVDDDQDIADLLHEILIDDGFAVTVLYDPSVDAVRVAVDKIEPACVVLDGAEGASYGSSWEIAEWLASRPRPIPTIMITGHGAEQEEAMLGQSGRAQAARFAGMIPKPFNIDAVADAVRRAAGVSPEPAEANDRARASELYERLRAAGARDLQVSRSGRQWATFRIGRSDMLMKVYRWRLADMYFVGRYSADGRQLRPLARFSDLDALIAYCLRTVGADAAK